MEENNQSFIEKINNDILKELKSIEDTYKFFYKGNDKYNYDRQKSLVWSRNNQRETLFKNFVNEFKDYSNQEINDLMMEVLESDDNNFIKDRMMIIYNIILSENLNKSFDFKIEKVDYELIEENERRAKNRQWHKDKINLTFKIFRAISCLSILLSPFFYMLYVIATNNGLNSLSVYISVSIMLIMVLFFVFKKIPKKNNSKKEVIEIIELEYNEQQRSGGQNKTHFFHFIWIKEVNELSKKEIEREFLSSSDIARRFDEKEVLKEAKRIGAGIITPEERQESLRKAGLNEMVKQGLLK